MMIEERIAEIEKIIEDARFWGALDLITVSLIAEYEDLCDQLDMREVA